MLRSTYQASFGLFLLFISIPLTLAQTTLTYQGQLQEGGNLVDDETVGLFFELYDDPDPATGTLISSDGPFSVAVEDGLFQAELDFGEVDYTVARYLRIQVNGTWLAETQEITSVPVAQYALGAGEVQWANVLNAPGFWRVGGNAGTTPGTDILGTTDDTPLELHVNGQRALRLEPGDGPNLIGGSAANSADAGVVGAFIAGGNSSNPNSATGNYAVIGGGRGNTASGRDSTVGGGKNNTASGYESTIGGGDGNSASGYASSTVSGGFSNSADGAYSTVGGGVLNTTGAEESTVGGGRANSASALYSTVPGGRNNEAAGYASFAAGNQAHALHEGAFVWADSEFSDFTSSEVNEFAVRAAGGVRLVVGTTTCTLEDGDTAFNCSSSSARDAKTDVEVVSPTSALERVAKLPLYTWRYRNADPDDRHLGPMAGEFAEAFGLGDDDTRIHVLDLAGVALAAVQGLHEENRELRGEVAELREVAERNAEMAERNRELEQRLAALEAVLLDDERVARSE